MSHSALPSFLTFKIITLVFVSYSLQAVSSELAVSNKLCQDAVVHSSDKIPKNDINQYESIIGDLVELRLGHLPKIAAADYSEVEKGRESTSPWFPLITNDLLREKQMELEAKLGKDVTVAIFREVQRRVSKTLNKAHGIVPSDANRDGMEGKAKTTAQILRPRYLGDLIGHTRPILSAIYSPDGQRILTTSRDYSARVWDAATRKPLLELIDHTNWVRSGIFSSNQEKIVTTADNGITKIWEGDTGKLLFSLNAPPGINHTQMFAPNGKQLLTTSSACEAKVWNLETKKRLFSLLGHTRKPLFSLEGHTMNLNKAIYSPNGKRIVTISEDKLGKVWDAEDGSFLFDLKGHKGPVLDVQFSPDGERILTAGTDKLAKVWDAKTGQHLFDLVGHDNYVLAIQYSPDGKRIVTVSRDHLAKVWDADTGAFLFDLNGHSRWVRAVEYSPDGEYIITAADDSLVKMWDSKTGAFLFNLKGHTDKLISAHFSPDGKNVVTVSEDGSAKVWSLYENVNLDETFLDGKSEAEDSP